jgi:hypothetical protein
MKTSAILKVTVALVLLVLFRQTVAKAITFAGALDSVTAQQLDLVMGQGR